jgi:hypothetical protein
MARRLGWGLPALGSDGTTTCETTTWGNAQEGGIEKVCQSDDGSSTWYTAEWSDGVLIEDAGSVTMNPGGGFTVVSGSRDLSTSAPTKFRNDSPHSGYAR